MPRRLIESLERIAWEETARGHSCCAQQAHQLSLRLQEALQEVAEGVNGDGALQV